MNNYSNYPVPEPVSGTADSFPWNAAERQLVPIPLPLYHYREEEYFLKGTANLYALANDSAVVTRENIPYTDRILVRFPEDMSEFDGNVFVELLNSTNGWDVAPMWALTWPGILADHSIYVGVTIHPVSIASMKQYDPERYAPLTMAVPESRPVSHKVLMWQHCTEDTDFGLSWDILTQVGEMLKDGSLPFLQGRKADRVFAMGCSQSAMFLSTYVNVFHETNRPSPIRPPFDGYLPFTGSVMVPLTQHQDPPEIEDPIQVTKNCPVPFLRIMSQWDFRGFAGDLLHRRPDSDDPGDRFRLYEIAGQAHNPFVGSLYRPGQEEMRGIGREAKYPANDISELPTDAIVRQALRNLVLWSKDEAVPPRCESGILTGPDRCILSDALGNPLGGLRLPQLEVPAARYYSGTDSSPQDGCCVPFSPEVKASLYRDQGDYIQRWCAAVNGMLRRRFISPEDADLLIRRAFTEEIPVRADRSPKNC